jgi:uncharacterized protein (DUF2235 family)
MALYAFDGTWNSATLYDSVVQADETNVARFCEAYRQDQTWYVSGPGTRHGKVGRVIGGVAGAGGFDRVAEAYAQLCLNFAAGDTIIDVIGFSRGAALSLDFANRICDLGIRRPGSKEVVVEDPEIRFLGLWDVVGSFGVPIGHTFNKVNLGHKLFLPGRVQYCFHAMAMDERRQTFRVTRLENAYEVWFRGVHSDVGGGNGNVGLSSIGLLWMLRKATAVGLPISAEAIEAAKNAINTEAALKPPTDLLPNNYRGFMKDDRFHYTVGHRDGHNNAPANSRRESESDEANAQPVRAIQHNALTSENAVTDPDAYPPSAGE